MPEVDDYTVELFHKTVQFINKFDMTDELADYFKQQGIKAYCGNGRRCAIAQYLTNTVPLPDGFEFHVGVSVASIVPALRSIGVATANLDIIPRHFISLFDSHAYRDLEVSGEEEVK